MNLHRIEKDVQRCDRNYWYFTPANLEKLRNIMCRWLGPGAGPSGTGGGVVGNRGGTVGSRGRGCRGWGMDGAGASDGEHTME